MRFSVRHQTLYRYSAPVTLAPHVLRLNPRVEAPNVRSASLTVDPVPATRYDATDRFGNRITHVSFAGATDRLCIDSAFDIDTPAAAPLHGAALPRLPWPAAAYGELADYGNGGEAEPAVCAFASALAAESGWEALPFLEHLNVTLFNRFNRHIRIEGAAQSPAHTLASGTGACRDLTVLFMAACRCVGVVARFVSGYQAHAGTDDGQRYLHAWPEVFLPSLGWRGFDPTHGTPVSDAHVALCAAPAQSDTMPVEGGFYFSGSDVTSTLDFRVEIAAN